MSDIARTDQSQAPSPLASFRNLLDRMTGQFEAVMPKQTVDRFKRIIVTTLSDDPDLLRCSQRSLISVCMHAAQDGLQLDNKEAAVVPFRDGPELIAQYMPMIAGLRKKVRNSSLLSDWNVQVVHEGDEFDFALGDRPYIHHKPALQGGRTRRVVGAYSIATFPDGTKSFEFMNIDQIEDVRSKSKARKGPWADPIFYPEMCRKTVARLHAKQLPMSTDLEMILRREDAIDNAIETTAGKTPPLPPPRPSSVGNVLDQFGAGALSPPAAQEDDQSEPGAGDQAAGGAGIPPTEQSARAPDAPQQQERSPIEVAYECGKQARAAGSSRKAIPGEYRANDKTREALAWYAGLDGQPMPVSE